MNDSNRYPKSVAIKEGNVSLTLMTPDDKDDVQAFSATLPPNDLLFLRRDMSVSETLPSLMATLFG